MFTHGSVAMRAAGENPEMHTKIRDKSSHNDGARFRSICPQQVTANQRMQCPCHDPDGSVITAYPNQVDNGKAHNLPSCRCLPVPERPVFVQPETITCPQEVGNRIIHQKQVRIMCWKAPEQNI